MRAKNPGNIERKHNAKERDGWPRTHELGRMCLTCACWVHMTLVGKDMTLGRQTTQKVE